MDIKCTDKELFILKKIAHAAQELGVETYLIGGFVRDKIIARDTKDADIFCVGDGIELASQNPPDLILMDIAMPEMNGLEATNYIRSLPHISGIKIIALTANAMQGDREMVLEAGCDGYISKPIDIDSFVDELWRFLK